MSAMQEPTSAAEILARHRELKAKFYPKPVVVKPVVEPEPEPVVVVAEPEPEPVTPPVFEIEIVPKPFTPAPEIVTKKDGSAFLPPSRDVLVLASDPEPPEQITRVTVRGVIGFVSRETGISSHDIIGPRRARMFVTPRQIAYWLARKYMPFASLPEIGRRFGGRDHTTVMWGCRMIEKHVQSESDLGLYVNYLDRRFRISMGFPSASGDKTENWESELYGEEAPLQNETSRSSAANAAPALTATA